MDPVMTLYQSHSSHISTLLMTPHKFFRNQPLTLMQRYKTFRSRYMCYSFRISLLKGGQCSLRLLCQLEVMQYVGMGGGDPVSTVDFERMPVDRSMTARMVAESRRELISATEKTLDQVWGQHKTLIVEHFFEEFERSKLLHSSFLLIFY